MLETTFEARGGNVTLYDFFSVTGDGERGPQIVRVLEATRGSVDMEVRIAPRFDYGEVRPWIRRHGHRLFSAIGGNDGLVVWCDEELEENPEHELTVRFTLAAGDRRHLSLTYCAPEKIDAHEGPDEPDAGGAGCSARRGGEPVAQVDRDARVAKRRRARQLAGRV